MQPNQPTLLLTSLESARMLPTRRDGTMRKRVGFGTERATQLNPLLSLVEDWMNEPGGYVEHMHKGFETVTLVLGGQVLCSDANGTKQLLSAHDVQWVRTGSGVMHAEMAEGEGEAHMISVWLNLPAAHKLEPPSTITLPAASIPQVDAAGLKVRVIAGEFGGQSGPIRTPTSARLLDISFDQGATLRLPISSGQLGFAYVARGEVLIGTHSAREGDLVHFSSKLVDTLPFAASLAAQVLVLHAPPLAEPVVVNGPFVMNTATQIQEAYADFRAGRFASPQEGEQK